MYELKSEDREWKMERIMIIKKSKKNGSNL